MRFEQRFSHRAPAKQCGALIQAAASLLGCFAVSDVQRFARQREAVGVQPRTRNAEQHVAPRDLRTVDDFVAFDDANDEAGEVEVADRVDVRHVGRLTAEEGTILRRASPGHALDDGLLLLGGQTVSSDVVEEEDRLCAAGHDVVDAVAKDVRSAEVQAIRRRQQLDLRADAVGAGREHRVAVLVAHAEKAAERPGVAQHLWAARLGEDAREAGRELAPRGDIHASGGVRLLFCHRLQG